MRVDGILDRPEATLGNNRGAFGHGVRISGKVDWYCCGLRIDPSATNTLLNAIGVLSVRYCQSSSEVICGSWWGGRNIYGTVQGMAQLGVGEDMMNETSRRRLATESRLKDCKYPIFTLLFTGSSHHNFRCSYTKLAVATGDIQSGDLIPAHVPALAASRHPSCCFTNSSSELRTT